MKTLRALQIYKENDEYRVLDCYTKTTSICNLEKKDGEWILTDKQFGNTVYHVIGKHSSDNVDATMFFDGLPVIVNDNFVDLWDNGQLIKMGKNITPLMSQLQTVNNIHDGEIIVVEKSWG